MRFLSWMLVGCVLSLGKSISIPDVQCDLSLAWVHWRLVGVAEICIFLFKCHWNKGEREEVICWSDNQIMGMSSDACAWVICALVYWCRTGSFSNYGAMEEEVQILLLY